MKNVELNSSAGRIESMRELCTFIAHQATAGHFLMLHCPHVHFLSATLSHLFLPFLFQIQKTVASLHTYTLNG